MSRGPLDQGLVCSLGDVGWTCALPGAGRTGSTRGCPCQEVKTCPRQHCEFGSDYRSSEEGWRGGGVRTPSWDGRDRWSVRQNEKVKAHEVETLPQAPKTDEEEVYDPGVQQVGQVVQMDFRSGHTRDVKR